jgi:polysaccharide biosynthesis protein PslG
MTSRSRSARFRRQARYITAGGSRRARSRAWIGTVVVAVLLIAVGYAAAPSSASLTSGRNPIGHSAAAPSAHASRVVAFHDPVSRGVNGVAFTRNGKFLATADGNGRAYVWSVTTHKIVARLHDPGGKGVNAVAFRPESNVLAAGDANGHVYLWTPGVARPGDLADPGSKGVRDLAFTPDGAFLAVADANGHAYVWSLSTDRIVAILHHPGNKSLNAVAFNADGKLLAAGGFHGRAYVWAAPEVLKATLDDPGSKGVRAVAFRPGSNILVTGDASGHVYLWKPGVHRPGDLADPASRGVRAVAFTSDGAFLAVADANGHVYLWSLAKHKIVDILRDPDSKGVAAVAFSTDGRRVAAGDADGNAFLSGFSPAVHRRAPRPHEPVGYAAHVLAQPDAGHYVKLIEDGGATSLRDDVTWASVEPTRGRFDWSGVDRLVTLAATHHLHVLMVVDTSPAWASGASTREGDWFWLPPRRPADYGRFAAAVAARYRAGGAFWREHPTIAVYPPAGIELWNEENLSGSWGGRTPDPEVYAAMVKAAYTRIKHVAPKMTVLIGGLAPAGAYDDVTCSGIKGTGHDSTAWNGLNYLQALYAHGIHGHFDAVAWHPYSYWKGATAAQMLAYDPCSAWTQMAGTPVSVRSLMVSHGDASKRIWITEAGAPTCTAGLSYICVTAAQQADLAIRETRLWRSRPWAGGFYWYDIRDDNRGATSPQSHFGAVSSSNIPKSAYAALRRAWRISNS